MQIDIYVLLQYQTTPPALESTKLLSRSQLIEANVQICLLAERHFFPLSSFLVYIYRDLCIASGCQGHDHLQLAHGIAS
jgi:hypothetical protein